MPAITKDEVSKIANLARLDLTEAEKEKLTNELGDILAYMDKLKEVDTDGVEPTAQVTGLENILRKDESMQWWDGNPFDLVESATDHEGNFVKVKEVFKSNDE